MFNAFVLVAIIQYYKPCDLETKPYVVTVMEAEKSGPTSSAELVFEKKIKTKNY